MKKLIRLSFAIICCITLCPAFAQLANPYKAPLYWSVYENHIVKEQKGISDNYITEDTLLANINWVNDNLKSSGYKMICMDGWGDITELSAHGYRKSHSRHWQHDFAWWSDFLQQKGMTLGMYGNPLWVHVADNDVSTKIVGTDIPVSSLKNSAENAMFPWVQVEKPGAEAYVKGYIKYYADMGIKYFRVDFLSWYESGQDRYLGRVGPSHPREYYVTALKWMREAADANGVFLSLVMPNLFNEAEAEKQYGHMFRINEDAGEGTWYKWNEKDRGQKRTGWSVYANAMDGLTYWSHLAGKGKVILDPDFLRLNTFESDAEKRSVISACIIAGAPVTISDQFNTIGNNLWLYKNEELLALNADGFVGKPLSNDPTQANSQVWKGQLSNGDWVIALFNRENTPQQRSLNFSDLGITGSKNARDLWQHANLGSLTGISVTLAPHDCIVLKLSGGAAACNSSQAIILDDIADQSYNAPPFTPGGFSTSGLPLSFQIAAGPATIMNNQIRLTGFNGTVYVVATQLGNATQCAAIPKLKSFAVTGGHNQAMYVAGSFNSWNLTPMRYKNGDWILDAFTFKAGNYELKFANTGNWSGNDWGNASGLTGVAVMSTGGAPNLNFSITQAGSYEIRFNDITGKYSITYKGSAQAAMYYGGSFNGWALTGMVFDNGVWHANGVQIDAGSYEMKFANTPNWSGDDWGNQNGLSGTAALSTGGAPNISFSVQQSGMYDISFNDVSLEYSISPAAALPLVLQKFNAVAWNDQVKLSWQVVEEAIAFYQVEWSTDGNSFSAIGNVSGIGNGNRNYSFFDRRALPPNNIYRLRIVHSNGNTTFSPLVTINVNRASALLVYPCPVTNGIVKISGVLAPGRYQLSIFNLIGQEVYRNSFNHDGNDHILTLRLPRAVLPGSYHLLLAGNGRNVSRKLVVN